jgi:hypothetical protein
MRALQRLLVVALPFLAAARCLPPADFTDPLAFKAAALARAEAGELIIFITNNAYFDLARALSENIRALGHDNFLTVTFEDDTCLRLTREHGSCCGWSNYLKNHSGWAGWGVRPNGAHAHRLNRTTMYSWKWWYSSLALSERLNVLMLDTDVRLFASPYPMLHGPFYADHNIVAQVDAGQPRDDACASVLPGQLCEGSAQAPSLNAGIMYFKNVSLEGGAFQLVNGTIQTIVRQLDKGAAGPITNCTDSSCPPDKHPDWELIRDQTIFNKLLARMSGPVWSVGAAPRPSGSKEGGPDLLAAAQPAIFGALQGGGTVVGAPDSLFTRTCASLARVSGNGLVQHSGADAASRPRRADAWWRACPSKKTWAEDRSPAVAGHMLFMDNDAREIAWKSLGWWPELRGLTAARAAAARHCLSDGSVAVLFGYSGAKQAILCGEEPGWDGCPCCVDIADANGGNATWDAVQLAEGADARAVASCSGFFRRG